ncbi:UNVERIFIED_CONTAM: hypothetical protein PYX00_004238 [Menopon gallinae]|uniref:Gustatory receptor n=1 Tax=Menopon gallinae TaxID=328185 RepID=A0AAW2I4F1_9NEOP
MSIKFQVWKGLMEPPCQLLQPCQVIKMVQMGCKIKGKLLEDDVDRNVVLWPMLTVFRITGVLPVSIRWVAGKNGYKYVNVTACKFYLAVSALLLLVTIVHTLWAPMMLLRLEKSIMVAFAKTKEISHNLTMEHDRQMLTSKQAMVVKILHPLLICITSLTARGLSVSLVPRRIPRLMKKLNRIDEVLSVPSEMCRSNGAALLSFIAVLFILNIPLMAYHLWQLSFFHSGWGNAWEAFSIFNIFTTFSMEFQFMTLCYVARSRLAYINEKLGDFVADEFASKTPEFFRPSRKRKIDVEVLSSILKIDLSKEVSRCIQERSLSLRSLRSGHILLGDVMDDINSIYQIHLLVSIFSSISKILFNLYFSIFGFITSTKNLPSKIQRRQMYIVCFWTVFYCLRFLLIVVFAHLTSKESAKTKGIVTKIDPRIFEESEKEEIKMFWEHLSGRDFEFSACGLFNLNMALITSTFSSGITYLVIMAQFHS